MCFGGCHYVQVWGGGRYPEMNKFERVSGDDHQVSVAGGGYSEMNKFKQVSSDDHQISVVGKGRGMGITHDMSRWWGVSYHVTYPMMHLMLPTIYSGQNDRRMCKHYLPATTVEGCNKEGVLNSSFGKAYIKTQSLTKEPFVFLRFFEEGKRIGKKRGCVFIIINIETSSRWRFHETKMVL